MGGDGVNDVAHAGLRCTVAVNDQYLDAVVSGFEVREALSESYRLRATLTATAALDPEEMLAKPAFLTVYADDGTEARIFHGVVVSVVSQQQARESFRVRLEIAPKLELLKLGRDHRHFQEPVYTEPKQVPKIVTDVLKRGGLAEDTDFKFETNATYEDHLFVVQYGESDWDFIARLLHEEGIGYVIRNELDAQQVLFFDDDTVWQPIAGDANLFFLLDAQTHERRLHSLAEEHRAASDDVELRDYDFKRPAAEMDCVPEERHGVENTGRQVYVHPGNYVDTGRGKRLAQVLFDRLRLRCITVSGKSNVPALEPGRTFTVNEHPRVDLNADYVVLSVTHRFDREGGTTSYENEFVAVPIATPVRPEVTAPAPVMGGVQIGFCTGPSGAELHGSEFGEVKVRFPWDRSGITDDNSSTWARVGQLFMPGSMIVPRVKFEVIVDHELGDMDRPYVTGHLYNKEAMPPYELPAGNVKSTYQTATTDGGAGSNELRFDDTAGSEEMFINASKDYVCSVENDSSTEVSGNESSTIGGNSTRGIGGNQSAGVVGSRALSVGGNQNTDVGADHSEGVGGSDTLTVGGTRDMTIGGDLSEATAGTLDRTVGAAQIVIAVAGATRNIAADSKTMVGGAWIEALGKSRMSTCGAVRTETIGALKLIKAKTVAVDCGAAYVMNAATETVKAGGNRNDNAGAAMAVNVGGGISIKAANVNISGKSKVTFKVGGTTIEVKSGKVTIKSGKVDLKGVKKLKSSSSHKSGP
jgi:type VI secretion system secreted protein VgrG